jgi:hypothetical protein
MPRRPGKNQARFYCGGQRNPYMDIELSDTILLTTQSPLLAKQQRDDVRRTREAQAWQLVKTCSV